MPAEEYPEQIVEALARAIGLAADSPKRRCFAYMIRRWAGLNAAVLRGEIVAPTGADMRKSLRTIRDSANALRVLMDGLDLETRMHLWSSANAVDRHDGDEAGYRNINAVEILIGRLAEYADTAIDRLEKSGAKQRRMAARHEAIAGLAGIWFFFTGKRPTRINSNASGGQSRPAGSFHNFVVTALEPIFGNTEAASGIDDAIRSVLDMGKKTAV